VAIDAVARGDEVRDALHSLVGSRVKRVVASGAGERVESEDLGRRVTVPPGLIEQHR